MGVQITITVHNAGPHTIWGKLAAKLGREPTNQEAAAEVKRILQDAREAEIPHSEEWCRRRGIAF